MKHPHPWANLETVPAKPFNFKFIKTPIVDHGLVTVEVIKPVSPIPPKGILKMFGVE
jgi:hypothetical protein